MQDDTSVRLRFARKLPGLALLALASGYGCGQAPNGLFTSGSLNGVGAASAGGAPLGVSGSANVGGSSVSSGGSGFGGSIALGGDGGSQSAAGASPGGASNAGGDASSAGAASGGAPGGSASGGSAGAPINGGGSGGAAGPSACDAQLMKPPALVSDFEQGVAGWFAYVGGASAQVTSIEPGADMTQHAGNFSGGAAKISGMYFPMPCRDVSDFDGIAFWGRSEGATAVRFLAVIPKTDPTAGIGDCNSGMMTCSDHPGKPFTFSSQWTHYHAAWAELKQLGFGAKASFSNVLNALLWINDGQVQHFNFSIDEVTFYQGAPPAP